MDIALYPRALLVKQEVIVMEIEGSLDKYHQFLLEILITTVREGEKIGYLNVKMEVGWAAHTLKSMRGVKENRDSSSPLSLLAAGCCGSYPVAALFRITHAKLGLALPLYPSESSEGPLMLWMEFSLTPLMFLGYHGFLLLTLQTALDPTRVRSQTELPW